MALFCCICESMGKSVPNFSKDKNTGLGYCGSHQNKRTDKKFQSIQQRAIEKHKLNPTKTPQKQPRFQRTIQTPTEREIMEINGVSGLNNRIDWVTPSPESYDGEKFEHINHDEMALWDSGGVDESLVNLSNDLDYVFSLYIRHKYADKNGMVKCFTCPKVLPIKEIQNGHYIKRSNRATRFLEINCHPQCPECNQDHNYDETPYTNALEAETPGITSELKELSKLIFKPTRASLKSLLIEYRHKLELVKRKLK